jgi:hypothetical protein
LLHHPALDGRRVRSIAASGLLVVLPLGFIALVPMPDSSNAEGVVWLPEHARVRAGGDGFIARILVANGQPVQVGEPLLEISDPDSAAQVQQLAARVAELEAEQNQAYADNPVRAQMHNDALTQARAELALVQRERAQRIVRSRSAGRFVMPHEADKLGRFVHKGEVLAQVLSPSQIIVRVAVGAADVAQIRATPKRSACASPTRRARPGRHAWCAKCRPPAPNYRAPRSAIAAAVRASPTLPTPTD